MPLKPKVIRLTLSHQPRTCILCLVRIYLWGYMGEMIRATISRWAGATRYGSRSLVTGCGLKTRHITMASLVVSEGGSPIVAFSFLFSISPSGIHGGRFHLVLDKKYPEHQGNKNKRVSLTFPIRFPTYISIFFCRGICFCEATCLRKCSSITRA